MSIEDGTSLREGFDAQKQNQKPTEKGQRPAKGGGWIGKGEKKGKGDK